MKECFRSVLSTVNFQKTTTLVTFGMSSLCCRYFRGRGVVAFERIASYKAGRTEHFVTK